MSLPFVFSVGVDCCTGDVNDGNCCIGCWSAGDGLFGLENKDADDPVAPADDEEDILPFVVPIAPDEAPDIDEYFCSFDLYPFVNWGGIFGCDMPFKWPYNIWNNINELNIIIHISIEMEGKNK